MKRNCMEGFISSVRKAIETGRNMRVSSYEKKL
jgi:hypothetical protein